MTENFLAVSDAATVQRLARIIRDGTDTECIQAFNDLNAGKFTVEMWAAAETLADAWSEAENVEGGA